MRDTVQRIDHRPASTCHVLARRPATCNFTTCARSINLVAVRGGNIVKIYSYIEVDSQTFQPPPLEGPGDTPVTYLALIDDRHYIAVTGSLPPQSPGIQLQGPLDLAADPALRERLTRHAEPWRMARQSRAEAYPDIADQLDAIMKEFAALRAQGQLLTPELNRVVDACMAVKTRYPKSAIGLD